MAKKVIVAIVVLVVLGGGAYLLMHKKKSPEPGPLTSNTQNSSNNAGESSSANNAAATITYSDNGFSPSKITVKAGQTVAIKNTSSHDMQFDSDPHPVHTDDTDLNVGVVSPGQTMTFTPTKKGAFGYHNHLNPSDTGTIIIQ